MMNVKVHVMLVRRASYSSSPPCLPSSNSFLRFDAALLSLQQPEFDARLGTRTES